MLEMSRRCTRSFVTADTHHQDSSRLPTHGRLCLKWHQLQHRTGTTEKSLYWCVRLGLQSMISFHQPVNNSFINESLGVSNIRRPRLSEQQYKSWWFLMYSDTFLYSFQIKFQKESTERTTCPINCANHPKILLFTLLWNNQHGAHPPPQPVVRTWTQVTYARKLHILSPSRCKVCLN